MQFARQMNLFGRIVDLSQVIDPEFVRRDPCLNCSLPFDCDESDPGCRYQNELPQRTIAVDALATLPLALRRQRERLRRNWNKQDAAKREEQCTVQR